MNKVVEDIINTARRARTDRLVKLKQDTEALDQGEESRILNRLACLFRRGAEAEWLPNTKQPYVPVYKWDCPIVLKALEFWQAHHKGDEDNG